MKRELTKVKRKGRGRDMKHNIYFDGKVQSIRFSTSDGDVSVGSIEPGEYSFTTETPEHVEVLTGSLQVVVSGNAKDVSAGSAYDVPARTTFSVACNAPVSYLCFFRTKADAESTQTLLTVPPVLYRTPTLIQTIIDGLDSDVLNWQPSEERWSVRMVIAHLAEAEVNCFRARLMAVASSADENPVLPKYDQLAAFKKGPLPSTTDARPTTQMTNASGSRIQSVDALRGAIMVLMALDHVRDYTSYAAMHFNPVDLSRTTAVIFFTRWVTHVCAPVFAFSAGIGAFFWYQHGRSKSQLSRFLITRGLWLMFLEFTVVRFLYFFQVQWRGSFVILTVFWMLGLSMIVLAALAHLPMKILAALSVLVIAGHNLLDPVSATSFGRLAPLWNVLHQLSVFPVAGGNVLVAYTLVPWFAVMSAGFCFGPILLWDPPRRRSFLIRLGLALSVAFVLLRAWNHYGDPAPWSHQPTTLFTFLSFLNTNKYPPSLLFLLMTLGPALIALAWLERVRFSRGNPLIVFGRVPFFYFLFHFAVAHLLAIGLGALRYGPHRFLLLAPPSLGTPADAFPPDYGFRLYVVYLCWLLVVAIAYPVCRWYADVKNRRRDLWWLSYL